MKKLLVATALIAGGLWSTLGAAQEMAFRRAVVTGIAPIQVEAQSQAAASSGGTSAAGGALGRAFGRAISRAASKAAGAYGYEAADVAGALVQDVATAPRAKPSAGLVTAYMVMVRFDNGQESAIQAATATGLRVGGKVNVIGSGSATQIVPAS